MKAPKNTRFLAAGEIEIAKKVFKDTLPYDQIVVSDGLGQDDRPFTVPTNVPMNLPFYANFNVKDGKFVLHVGDGYYGMSTIEKDKELLIHELTHVWQGTNDTSWSWAYMIFSAKDQLLSDNAYAYDHNNLKPWKDYGPEQQAKIVEDWYVNGMQTYDPVLDTGDRRFYYIKKHLWGETVEGDWTIRRVRRLESATLKVTPYFPDSIQDYLLPILETVPRSDDHAGIEARKRKLEESFRQFSPEVARPLLARLEAKKRDDKLAQSFKHRLATPTRDRLLHMLRAAAARP